MAGKEVVHARFLVNPDTGKAELVHADDVAERSEVNPKVGWKEPTGLKPNGEAWNDPEEGVARDAAAEAARTTADLKGKKDAAKAKELEANRRAAEAAAEKVPPAPDFKVQIVAGKAKKAVAKAPAKKSRR